jgi:hypothetical protein
MKRLLGFGIGILAAAVLSGCSGTLHPMITAQIQGLPGGYGLLINGTGFSPTNPCTSLSLVGYPTAGTITSIDKQVPCTIGSSTASFANYTWPIPLATCPNANVSTISAAVLAVDIKTIDPAQATVAVPCTAPVVCPSSLKGSQIPTANWSASSTAPAYYAYQSAIFNSKNGAPIATEASRSTIESAMGTTAFNAATFTVPAGTSNPGTGGGLPNGVISCAYDSPGFTYHQQPAKAQVTIACTTTCGSL